MCLSSSVLKKEWFGCDVTPLKCLVVKKVFQKPFLYFMYVSTDQILIFHHWHINKLSIFKLEKCALLFQFKAIKDANCINNEKWRFKSVFEMIEKITLHLVPFNKQHYANDNNSVLYDGNANIWPINATPYTQYCKNYLSIS